MLLLGQRTFTFESQIAILNVDMQEKQEEEMELWNSEDQNKTECDLKLHEKNNSILCVTIIIVTSAALYIRQQLFRQSDHFKPFNK